LSKITEGGRQQTKQGRYSHLKAFFNFIKTNLDPTIQNSCDAPVLRKLYRPGKPIQWDVVEKETMDEIIIRTTKVRNRLILELMARGGMRVGEVLKLTPKDVNEQKLTIQNPKSGKDAEVVFIPRKEVDRLRAYMKDKAVEPEHRGFFRSRTPPPGSSSRRQENWLRSN
jgi:integrase/recombinase XerD